MKLVSFFDLDIRIFRIKGISIETKRDALRKFYLFEKSWQGAKPEGIDWNLHPDLLAFLESL